MTETWELSLVEGCRLVRQRELSCREWVGSVLDRVEATEPEVNAFDEIAWSQAREDAARLDTTIAGTPEAELAMSGDRCLLGAAVSVKANTDVAGMPTRAGSRWYERVAGQDAELVRRIRAQGGVIVGKTTAHEFGFGVDRPMTRSPWGENLYPGGSSVGSGVSVAMGSSVVSVGTDAGGSVRIPAAVNALVGMRPGPGKIPLDGIFPLSTSYGTPGPLARTVGDCAELFGALTGRPLTPAVDALEVGGRHAPRLRAGVIAQLEERPRDPAYRRVFHDVEDAGIELVPVEFPDIAQLSCLQLTIMLAEAAAIHHPMVDEHWDQYGDEVKRMLLQGALVSAVDYLEALRARDELQRRLVMAMDSSDVDYLCQPTIPQEAASVDDVLGGLNEDSGAMGEYVRFTFLASVANVPALSVPVGRGAQGRPLGLELLARRDQEEQLLRVGMRVEEIGVDSGWDNVPAWSEP